MRIPGWGLCLLGVACFGFVGCSQTGWLRPKGPSDLKTEASINGRPVSTAEGEPGLGTARREDIDDTMPPSAAGSRISGRVFDREGRAVPNVKVRVGVGGTTLGRLPFATTDRSGAFTLHGLRPGRDYTLIAEYQAEDGMMTGQVQTQAPEAGVRIALGPRDLPIEPRNSGLLSSRVRSGPSSDGPADGFPAKAHPRVLDASGRAEGLPDRGGRNVEMASRSSRVLRSSAASTGSESDDTTIRAGWTIHRRPSAVASRRSQAEEADGWRDGPPSPEEGLASDDAENPLPPALEPLDSYDSRGSGRRGGREIDEVAEEADVVASPEKSRPRRASVIGDSGPSSDRRELRSFEPAPPRRAGRPDADAEELAPRSSRTPRRNPRGTSPANGRSNDSIRSSLRDPDDRGDPTTDRAPGARSNRRPTWRELAIDPEEVPVDEALRRSSAAAEELEDRGSVTRAVGPSARDDDDPAGRAVEIVEEERAPRSGTERPKFASRTDPAPIRSAPAEPAVSRGRPAIPPSTKSNEPVCRLDASHRRIVELRLPQLDGRLASLDEIDADLILLDFWGSWCHECAPSIEHHRQLQERLGDRRIQIVGIACEKGTSFESRRDAAIAAAGKLGINYPILVTPMDGTSPAQKALQVQFYPSMILLDREGNILQFEQGATDATLARIDRAIDRALRERGRHQAE